MKPVTIAGLQAWTSTTTHADHTTRSVVITVGPRSSGAASSLDLAVAHGRCRPAGVERRMRG